MVLSFSASADTADMNRFESKISDELASELGKYYSPKIEGRTLYIKGAISTHIYDFIMLEYKRIVSEVDVIELNSLGGSTEWAFEISRKIAALKKNTKVSSGSFCASACVYLFSAGVQRKMDADTWLGFHGSRLGAGFFTKYFGVCFVDMEDGAEWTPTKKGCKETLEYGYKVALEATNEGFDFMESQGVASSFRTDFFAMEDDPTWPASANMLKKPDWILSPEDALKYKIAN